ncbi:MAG: Phospholipid/cholesterol/gamma-HCH transport system substrate-binding protein [Frankiales bacterium]|nr:Phospholipid/cholesterol/gamma-HCH transport system substrate-binding protein [Frankiales bacterium]
MTRLRYQAYGVAMLVLGALFVAVCLAYFNQAFRPVSKVSLHISRSGLQLLPGSDVKVRGLIVGDVSSITSDGQGAVIHLRLDPKRAQRLPDNVSARLLPKTIFGEKYVDLILPATPSARHLSSGDVIPEDRSQPALEISKALDDLLPMLRSVQPAKLNQTLTALATALDGNGQQVGHTLEQLDAYFRQINPHLPALQHDITALVGVAQTYDEAAGSLLEALRNLTVTADTVVDRKEQLTAFLGDVSGAVDNTRDLLARNEQNIIAVNKINRPVVELLARYAPEYPCFFRGYAKLIPRIHAALPDHLPGVAQRNHAAHVVIEFVPSFPAYQYPLDLPQFNDTRGPNCYGLPNPPSSLPTIRFRDGTEDDPRFGPPPAGVTGASTAGSTAYSPAMGSAGTSDERGAMSTFLGPVLGLPSSEVPDLAGLLFGPMARGSAVNLS